MADQGLLGQSKPAGTTNTVLYSAPIDSSASTVLSIANDGSAADYDVAIKDYDQKLALDASTYKLHKGDIITGYRFEVNTAMTGSSGDFTPARLLLSDDGEKQVNFESFHIPAFTEIHVKKFAVRQVALESTTGTFVVGDNIVKGSGGNTATAIS